MSFSAGLTAVLRITEPAMFGVTLKVKKVLPCVRDAFKENRVFYIK